MSYGKVKETFWTDKKVQAMSDDAKMLALYLLTGPHRNMLGCMRVPNGYIMEDMGWPSTRLADAIAVLCQCQFIYRDDDGWTLIANQLRHDPLSKTPNHVKAAVSLAEAVPAEASFYQEFAARFAAALATIDMASAWHHQVIAIPLPSPEPLPEPEPEPEGEAPPAAARPDLTPAVETWNELAGEVGLAKAQVLTDKRRRSLARRLESCGGLEGWRAMLAKIRGSPGLQGVDGGWKADFDFVISETGFIKIMEGKYDGWGSGQKSKPSRLDNGFTKLAIGGGGQ